MNDSGLTVAIIPARGGSKGVPGKNLRRVGGVPLVERAVRAAASAVDLVVVSTDDEAIAAVARDAGARVVERPAELSGDEATSESALLHALDVLEGDGLRIGTVAFVQATSPFIPAEGIAEAVALIEGGTYDSVFSAYETYGFLWRR
ncbi:MAG: acylneuraminate cytidylyltransferase family protein, partial [Microbacterium sp.]|nr:acylneuraminate cytidylyltransferase family protein [Microbacterium sp.]